MIYVAYDHGGFYLAQKIKEYLAKTGQEFESIGSDVFDPKDDYTVFTLSANNKIIKSQRNLGIYICTTGFGSCIAANREKLIRAVVCKSVGEVKTARKKNNMNVLVLGSKFTCYNKALRMIKAFQQTPFDGGRHLKRVKDLTEGIIIPPEFMSTN